jgi:hypothetical protein
MIEEKLDGERIQLHKKGDKFQYWSRCVDPALQPLDASRSGLTPKTGRARTTRRFTAATGPRVL